MKLPVQRKLVRTENLLELNGLVKHYPWGGGVLSSPREWIRAVDGVSLFIRKGETLGLVGESGCGKSTLARVLLKLEQPTAGQILFKGEDVTAWAGRNLRELRKNMQIIFQDAYSSFNPRMTVEQIIGEPLLNFCQDGRQERRGKVLQLLQIVGLGPDRLKYYPHELSGGQRQRIGIARALALKPELIVCDEAIASLDVSIQAQILNLLKELKHGFGLSYLFISHDLAAVRYISDRVAVMYLGRIVEVIETKDLTTKAVHPYTQSLLAAVQLPDPGKRNSNKTLIKGEPPNPADPPSGCRFHPRCPRAVELCKEAEPQLRAVGPERWAACHLPAINDYSRGENYETRIPV